MSSESVNLIAFISAIYKTKIGKIKTTKTHSNETMPEKSRNDRSACVNIFSDYLLTDKFRYYLRMIFL